MRHVSLLVLFLLGLSAKSQNVHFYKCDSLLDCYYETKNYDDLIRNWTEIKPDSIPCLAHRGILSIMIDNGDEEFTCKTICHLIRKYGFDVRRHMNIYHVKDFAFDQTIADSLWQVWHGLQGNETLENNRAIKIFMEKEETLYQHHITIQEVSGREAFQRSLDSLFEDLMATCLRQGYLPNMELNGCEIDVSLHLFHMLAVSDTRLEKWCRIYPYIRAAFKKGMISNSYCFMYDRVSYEWKQCQNFGTLDERVPFCSCLCGEDVKPLKQEYLIESAYSFIQLNKQWLSTFDEMK